MYEDMFVVSIIILFLFFIIIKYMFMYIALLGEFATLYVQTGTRLLLHSSSFNQITLALVVLRLE